MTGGTRSLRLPDGGVFDIPMPGAKNGAFVDKASAVLRSGETCGTPVGTILVSLGLGAAAALLLARLLKP